ncbi:MAG: hypothetical protein M1827_002740 [Pycnora praestabilis]|nr:MAG: hypothetical protein M1827_002740 [Pycnora praestabilis]
MPDKPLTIATYAAGASFAAITLFYVFGPTYFIDGDSSASSSGARRKGVVGLSNPANDCFINSILQALAGLGDLRVYLIRELHRRDLDGPGVYETSVREDEGGSSGQIWKKEGLQKGVVTQALKEILDSLNERPLYRKTISAAGFVGALEQAFRTRISRNQQDAQEFLQVVAERLSDEYHAGHKARLRARSVPLSEVDLRVQDRSVTLTGNDDGRIPEGLQISSASVERDRDVPESLRSEKDRFEAEDGFPFEGKIESQIECQTCRFKPKPSATTFVTLTLHVPQKSSTTLNDCFDGLFQTEYIDDFKCDRCRLEHALHVRSQEIRHATSETERSNLEEVITKIRNQLDEDPEKAPEGVKLPDMKLAPKRRIAKHMRITSFPKIIAIHLSRSIFDPRSISTKNAAKVTFPEKLSLGGILDRRRYKLLGVVTHKGSHSSGHYESFRRQNLYPPFSTPNAFNPVGAYKSSANSNSNSPAIPIPQTPPISTLKAVDSTLSSPEIPSSASDLSLSPSTSSLSDPSTRPSSHSTSESRPRLQPRPRSVPLDSQVGSGLLSTSSGLNSKESTPKRNGSVAASMDMSRFKRKKKPSTDRWWRISDDKIKECKTSDVLSMQKEVYLLFYEIDREGDDAL